MDERCTPRQRGPQGQHWATVLFQVPGDKRWRWGGGLNGREPGTDALRFRNVIGGGTDEQAVCARGGKTRLHKNQCKIRDYRGKGGHVEDLEVS